MGAETPHFADASGPASRRPAPAPGPGSSGSGRPADLSRSLLGNLPCATCGYELQGLSVLGVCPECGSAVRATILAVVDPLADELRPIARPRLVATGLIGWSATGLVAVLVAWVSLAAAALYGWQSIPVLPWMVRHAGHVAAVLLWASGLFALLFVHPLQRVGAVNVLLGVVGCTLYAPLGWVVSHLTAMSIEAAAAGQTDLWAPRPDRSLLRIGAAVLVMLIIAGLRPIARVLVSRSLALRTGRVDRQTMLAVAAAAAIIALGDVAGYLAPHVAWGALPRTIGSVLMILGGALLTVGLAGALVDAVRIAAAVVAPSPALRQVVRPIDTPDAPGRTLGSTGEAPTRGGGM